MASLKHEIVYFSERVKAARAYIANHLKKKEQAKAEGRKLPKQRMPSEKTLNQHISHAIKFGAWCKSNYHVRHWEECRPYIQDTQIL